jgi:uncharacterized protein (TIGR02421 family)
MVKYSTTEIIQLIRAEKTFSGVHQSGGFQVKIDRYVPYLCAAIHHGHQFRDSLKPLTRLTEKERWEEEDPETGTFISVFPIALIALDSRYEYDLNRIPKEAIYDVAWNKKVWHERLSKTERKRSLQKYNAFYKVLKAIIKTLEKKFNGFLVFDVHSYNPERLLAQGRSAPTFNIGTSQIDHSKYGKIIDRWAHELSQVQLNGGKTLVRENDVFVGNGHFLTTINSWTSNTLVLCTEIKKDYVDLKSQVVFPEVVRALAEQLKPKILTTASQFARHFTNTQKSSRYALLSSELQVAVKEIDSKIFQHTRGYNLLEYVSPLNIESEKQRFFKSRYSLEPQFRYRPLKIDVIDLKRRLYQVPIEKIHDAELQSMYRNIIEGHINKIELLECRGSKDFLYQSLGYFKEPQKTDIKNAQYLLHCTEYETAEPKNITPQEAIPQFQKMVDALGLVCQFELAKNMASNAVFIGEKGKLKIKKDALFTAREVEMLAHHEIGVHFITSVNAKKQPLCFLRDGIPLNTHTQEGLAILAEYLSGSLTLSRLKILAHRVLAVRHMIRQYSFRDTFDYLVENHQMDLEQAFYLALRVYRGGGFTKDFLYLRGFRDVFDYYQRGEDISLLFLGKTELSYIPLFKELVNRSILNPASFVPDIFKHPKEENPILRYIIEGLK